MSVSKQSLERFADVRILCVVVALAVLGDLVTTMYGLSIGLPESNPFVRGIVENYGLVGMIALKGICVVWVAIIYKQLGKRYGIAAMLGLAIPQGIAVILNIITIAQA